MQNIIKTTSNREHALEIQENLLSWTTKTTGLWDVYLIAQNIYICISDKDFIGLPIGRNEMALQFSCGEARHLLVRDNFFTSCSLKIEMLAQ